MKWRPLGREGRLLTIVYVLAFVAFVAGLVSGYFFNARIAESATEDNALRVCWTDVMWDDAREAIYGDCSPAEPLVWPASQRPIRVKYENDRLGDEVRQAVADSPFFAMGTFGTEEDEDYDVSVRLATVPCSHIGQHRFPQAYVWHRRESNGELSAEVSVQQCVPADELPGLLRHTLLVVAGKRGGSVSRDTTHIGYMERPEDTGEEP